MFSMGRDEPLRNSIFKFNGFYHVVCRLHHEYADATLAVHSHISFVLR